MGPRFRFAMRSACVGSLAWVPGVPDARETGASLDLEVMGLDAEIDRSDGVFGGERAGPLSSRPGEGRRVELGRGWGERWKQKGALKWMSWYHGGCTCGSSRSRSLLLLP